MNTNVKTDGISFYNTLINAGSQKEHEYLYWEFAGYDGQVAVRMGKWKMIWKAIHKNNQEVELYDLESDVREEHNIMDKHPDLLKKFYEIVKKEHVTPENAAFRIEGLESLMN